MPAMRTIWHQSRELGQRTSAILKRLLLNHEHCHAQCVQRRDPETFQVEFTAASWAWAPLCLHALTVVVSTETFLVSHQAHTENLALSSVPSE